MPKQPPKPKQPPRLKANPTRPMDDKLVELGRIQRAHGIKGELHLVLNAALDEIPEQIGWVFLDIEGIPTPFFAEHIRPKSNSSLILKLRDIDSIDDTEELLGLTALIPAALIPQSDDDEIALADLVGYQLQSADGKMLGIITDFVDYGLNAVFSLRTSTDEVLIPAADELIVEYDEDKRLLTMDLPDGLLPDNGA